MKSLNDRILGDFNSDTINADSVMKRLNKALGKKRLGRKYAEVIEKLDPFAFSEKRIVEECLNVIPGWDNLTESQITIAIALTKEWVALASKEYKQRYRQAFNKAMMGI